MKRGCRGKWGLAPFQTSLSLRAQRSNLAKCSHDDISPPCTICEPSSSSYREPHSRAQDGLRTNCFSLAAMLYLASLDMFGLHLVSNAFAARGTWRTTRHGMLNSLRSQMTRTITYYTAS